VCPSEGHDPANVPPEEETPPDEEPPLDEEAPPDEEPPLDEEAPPDEELLLPVLIGPPSGPMAGPVELLLQANMSEAAATVVRIKRMLETL
jgi:hypothetical protein